MIIYQPKVLKILTQEILTIIKTAADFLVVFTSSREKMNNFLGTFNILDIVNNVLIRKSFSFS